MICNSGLDIIDMIINVDLDILQEGSSGRLTDDESSKHRIAAVSIPLAVFFRRNAEESLYQDLVAPLPVDDGGPLPGRCWGMAISSSNPSLSHSPVNAPWLGLSVVSRPSMCTFWKSAALRWLVLPLVSQHAVLVE